MENLPLLRQAGHCVEKGHCHGKDEPSLQDNTNCVRLQRSTHQIALYCECNKATATWVTAGSGRAGCVVKGKFYFPTTTAYFIPQSYEEWLPSELLAIAELERHIHGPSCGHELVRHDGHWDYLVSILYDICSPSEPEAGYNLVVPNS